MSKEEEALVRELLWTLVNNHVFFQHPDLIRILCIHENVIAMMMNSISRLLYSILQGSDVYAFIIFLTIGRLRIPPRAERAREGSRSSTNRYENTFFPKKIIKIIKTND